MTRRDTIIKNRRGTSLEWETANPILHDGEIGVATDLNNFKMGDGETPWLDLPYFIAQDDLGDLKGDKGDPGPAGPQGIQGEPGPAGADGGFVARTTAEVTTSSLANNATEDITVTLKSGYRLLKVETDVAARVRVYDSIDHRTADATRAIGTDPSGVHGVILDLVTTASTLAWWLSPVVDGYTENAGDTVPLAITNLSGSTDTVTVIFTWVRSE